MGFNGSHHMGFSDGYTASVFQRNQTTWTGGSMDRALLSETGDTLILEEKRFPSHKGQKANGRHQVR